MDGDLDLAAWVERGLVRPREGPGRFIDGAGVVSCSNHLVLICVGVTWFLDK